MNENKRMLTLLIAIILIIGIILIIAFWPEADKTFTCGVKKDKDYEKLGSVNYKQYECLSKEDSYVLVISDGLTNDEKKALNKAGEKASYGIYYISEEVSNSDLKTIKNDLKTDKVNYDNSSLVIVQDDKVTYGTESLKDSDAIYNLLKEANLIKFSCNATSDEEYENLSKLTYEQYDCLYNSDEAFILMITQSTCSYCKEFKPVINEYAGENNIPVYYAEIDTLGSEDSQKIMDSLTYFTENTDWGTPLTLGVKNKEVVAELSGYTDDTSQIESFVKKVGLK